MAFLRKHRDRYWLVHNFREGNQVRQVRLYAFDLGQSIDGELERAQQVVASCYAEQIASTWVAPVRQKLQEIQVEGQHERWEQQLAQISQLMRDAVQALDRLDGPVDAKNQLIWECIAELHERVRTEHTETRSSSTPDRDMASDDT